MAYCQMAGCPAQGCLGFHHDMGIFDPNIYVYDPTDIPPGNYRHGGKSLWSCHNVATGGSKCKAIRREHLALARSTNPCKLLVMEMHARRQIG